MNLLSGVVATVLMIAAFQITGADSSRYFAAVLGLTISTTTISYLFIFPALIKLRYSRPDVKRPYRVPGGTAERGSARSFRRSGRWSRPFPALAGPGRQLVRCRGNPNDSLADLSFSHQRLQYELTQIVPLLVIVVIGIVFYFLGGKARQQVATEPMAPDEAPVGDADLAADPDPA